MIPLAQPLAPQQSIAVDLTYEGTAALSATRLEQIGTPADVAEASDWDRVSDEFVGLRGFGNVAWYPVASVPVALGDGAKFFTEAAAERQRQSQATVTMRVTEEFFGEAPNLAVLDGETLTVTPTTLPAAVGARNRDLHAAPNPVGIGLTQPVSAHPYCPRRAMELRSSPAQRMSPTRRPTCPRLRSWPR